MPDVITGNTQVGPTKQELIAAIVQKELKFNASLAGYVYDVSRWAVKGAKTIKFPKLGSFTVEKRASAAAGTIQALASAVDELDLDQNAYVSWLIDTKDEIQSTLNWKLENAARAAAAHGRQVDLDIIAKALAVADDNFTQTGVITRDKFLAMRQALKKADGNLNDCVFAVSVDMETSLLKIDEFTRAEVYGSAVIPNGLIGKLYGVPVITHNGLADGTGFLMERTGLALGFQSAPAYGSQPEIAFGVGSEREAIDQLYGVAGLQLGEKGADADKTPLIIKITP
jgi:hypothetical protein